MVSHTGIEPVTPWLKVKCSTDWANGSYFGAGDEGRTRDIQLGRLTLYQLSYSRIIWFVVPRAGLEPARDKFPQDFKSCASTDFATKALVTLFLAFLLLTHNYSISISYLNYIVNTFFRFFYIFFNKKIARSLRLLQVGDELLFFIEKRIHPWYNFCIKYRREIIKNNIQNQKEV